MCKLIHVREGGIVAVAPGATMRGEHPMTSLHVQGFELLRLADAEVRLAPDEVAALISELVLGLPALSRRALIARLGAA